jgi:O-antigen/teichoic acid export membrane protein
MKDFKWVGILSKFVSIQLIVQALGFASGIIIIRTLSKEEYAYFTIANSLQSAMNVLSDCGISSGVLAIGGKVYQDHHSFVQLIYTSMRLRYYLGIVVVILVTPILLWLLISNGTSFFYASLIILVILIEFYFYLIDGILRIVPVLKAQIKQIQILDTIFASSRLLLVLLFGLTSANALIYASCSTIASGLKTFFLQRWNPEFSGQNILLRQDYQRQIKENISNMAVYSIFFCVQGQVTIWLISIFGQTQNIAEVGALGRLSVIFTVMTSVVSNLIVPNFSKSKSLRKLKSQYLKVLFFYSFLSLLLMILSISFPHQLLWIIGNKYDHLQKELLLVTLTTIVSSISSVAWSLNTSRGWVKDSWLIVPFTFLVQAGLLSILNLSTVEGVILFSFISSLPTMIINFFINYKGLTQSNFIGG